MIEVNASFRSVETSVTQVQASYERNALAVSSKNQPPPPPSGLNNQQQQIVDEVGISEEAIQKFEEATALIAEIQNYLDYLNGESSDATIQITANDNGDDSRVAIAGESTKLSASFTKATYKEESLDINAKFDDAGNLTELSIDKQSITAEYIKADLILEERQFFALA